MDDRLSLSLQNSVISTVHFPVRGRDLGRRTLKSQGLLVEYKDALSEDLRTIRSDIFFKNELELVLYLIYVNIRNLICKFRGPA